MSTDSPGVHIHLSGTLEEFIEFYDRISAYTPKGKGAYVEFHYEGKVITMLKMSDVQMCEVELVIKDKNGNPANVDGVPVWSSSDSTVAGISPDTTGMKCKVMANASGLCQVTVTADANLGTGVTELIGFLDVTVLGTATIIELVPGPITDQP